MVKKQELLIKRWLLVLPPHNEVGIFSFYEDQLLHISLFAIEKSSFVTLLSLETKITLDPLHIDVIKSDQKGLNFILGNEESLYFYQTQ